MDGVRGKVDKLHRQIWAHKRRINDMQPSPEQSQTIPSDMFWKYGRASPEPLEHYITTRAPGE